MYSTLRVRQFLRRSILGVESMQLFQIATGCWPLNDGCSMKCNKYKLKNDLEFLAYANEGEELSLSPFWEAELVEEDVDPGKKEYCELQIIHAPESWSIGRQTRDKRLENEHILSYLDLANAFFLLRIKSLQKSKSIRDAVLEKYTEVVQFVNLEDNEDTRRDPQSSRSVPDRIEGNAPCNK